MFLDLFCELKFVVLAIVGEVFYYFIVLGFYVVDHVILFNRFLGRFFCFGYVWTIFVVCVLIEVIISG